MPIRANRDKKRFFLAGHHLRLNTMSKAFSLEPVVLQCSKAIASRSSSCHVPNGAGCKPFATLMNNSGWRQVGCTDFSRGCCLSAGAPPAEAGTTNATCDAPRFPFSAFPISAFSTLTSPSHSRCRSGWRNNPWPGFGRRLPHDRHKTRYLIRQDGAATPERAHWGGNTPH